MITLRNTRDPLNEEQKSDYEHRDRRLKCDLNHFARSCDFRPFGLSAANEGAYYRPHCEKGNLAKIIGIEGARTDAYAPSQKK